MDDLNQTQKQQFDVYKNLLIEWNKKFNLTSPITLITPIALKTKHFDDSLTYAAAIEASGFDLTKQLDVCDVGSGAGFPGLPLKIIYPHWNMTLIEATTKKCLFLEEVIKQLDLKGIAVINNRAENVLGTLRFTPRKRVASDESVLAQQTFDIVIARAVAPLEKLATWCLPLLKKNGVFITQKGQKELSAPPLSSPRRRGSSIEAFIKKNKNLGVKTLNYEEKVFVIISSRHVTPI